VQGGFVDGRHKAVLAIWADQACSSMSFIKSCFTDSDKLLEPAQALRRQHGTRPYLTAEGQPIAITYCHWRALLGETVFEHNSNEHRFVTDYKQKEVTEPKSLLNLSYQYRQVCLVVVVHLTRLLALHAMSSW